MSRIPAPRTAVVAALTCLGVALAGCGSDSAADSDAAAGETRTIDSQTGSVEIPARPERIAAIDWQVPPSLVDLGVTPVGMLDGSYEDADLVPEAYVDALSAVERVGTFESVDREGLAVAEPDLILAAGATLEKMINGVKSIAPTVQLVQAQGEKGGFIEVQRQIADVVGRTDEFEALEKKYDARVKELREEYAEVIDQTTWSSISGGSGNNWFLELKQTPTGVLLSDLGISFVDAGEKDGYWTDPLSLERMGTMLDDADVVLYSANFTGDANPHTQPIIDSGVFEQLPAVRAGHAFAFPDGQVSALGWAIEALDRLEATLEELAT